MSFGPLGVTGVEPVPRGRTALRMVWRFLPPHVRGLVERRLGARVVQAESRDAGFTPGFASVLTTADGDRVFVKAANWAAQKEFAAAYREEARILQVLGDTVPAPRLLWVEDDDWIVLGFEAVEASAPQRPWQPRELDRALDLAEEIASTTQSPPASLGLRPLWEDIPALLTGWEQAPDDWPHRDEAAALAARCPELPGSDRFLHSDLRDDNILLAADGRALACDWNWPALGPAWLDLVLLLVSARGDGLPVDHLLAHRELVRDADPEHVDAWLAAFSGFMLASSRKPVPRASPYLRQHASWYAEATWAWLAQRRGWA